MLGIGQPATGQGIGRIYLRERRVAYLRQTVPRAGPTPGHLVGGQRLAERHGRNFGGPIVSRHGAKVFLFVHRQHASKALRNGGGLQELP